MPKLIELLNKNKLTLIVALPQNDLELATAAAGAGADALHLSINSGETSSFSVEKDNIKKIIKKIDLPVGLGIGGKDALDEDEIAEMMRLGLDYVDLPVSALPESIKKSKKLAKIVMLDSRFVLNDVHNLSSRGSEAIDAAIIPNSGHGSNLVVGDLQNYIAIIMSAGIPVIIPTQRSIKISETAIIADTGAKGLMLTQVATGTTAAHIERAVREFRAAIDDLGE
ncbi:MAG: hypothetical protein PHH14_02175 [Candidatus Margulisbacteria bacterium]|nr:hypothetical protein [Candidatus Margulisiibacteriota bacterium]